MTTINTSAEELGELQEFLSDKEDEYGYLRGLSPELMQKDDRENFDAVKNREFRIGDGLYVVLDWTKPEDAFEQAAVKIYAEMVEGDSPGVDETLRGNLYHLLSDYAGGDEITESLERVFNAGELLFEYNPDRSDSGTLYFEWG